MKKVVAIDGPAGAGKSTLAKRAAQKLGYVYIDTGAMYRSVAWKMLQEYGDGKFTDEDVAAVADNLTVTLSYENGSQRIAVDGTDVSEAIRTPEVTAIVSRVAAIGRVRRKMVDLQQKMAADGGVIMDGRDIASKVLPNADVKIFLTASIEERANRRYREMKEKGFEIDLTKLQEEIAARDKADSEREESPLVRVPEAILLDTTNMNLDEAEAAIIKLVE
ncbi:MAG: (d)CMP kinase [Selenomonadaceae bacterium]|nr:(d)CMP kinase [Selenomonadaceae bacterium]